MDVDISNLELKIDQVVAFCQQLRDENHALRERVAALEREKGSLLDRMNTAREKLEAMMGRLPNE